MTENQDLFSLLPNDCIALIFEFLDEAHLLRVQRVSKTMREYSWKFRTHFDFTYWTTQPTLEELKMIVSRCNPNRIKEVKFVDEIDIDQRVKVISVFKNLQSLSLDSCSNLTIDGLVHISGLHKLKNLSLHRCNKLARGDIYIFNHLKSKKIK